MIPVLTFKRPLKGVNGRNWPGFLILDPAAEMRAAVWAQEAYEAAWKLRPWNLLRRMLSTKAREAMEIFGHEVEVQAAALLYGADSTVKRENEAWVLSWYDGLWRDILQDKRHEHVKKLMADKAEEAKEWVLRHEKQIRRHA